MVIYSRPCGGPSYNIWIHTLHLLSLQSFTRTLRFHRAAAGTHHTLCIQIVNSWIFAGKPKKKRERSCIYKITKKWQLQKCPERTSYSIWLKFCFGGMSSRLCKSLSNISRTLVMVGRCTGRIWMHHRPIRVIFLAVSSTSPVTPPP